MDIILATLLIVIELIMVVFYFLFGLSAAFPILGAICLFIILISL